MTDKILVAFESMYTGYACDNDRIYKELARRFEMDWEAVADYVCIHRYSEEDALETEEQEEEE